MYINKIESTLHKNFPLSSSWKELSGIILRKLFLNSSKLTFLLLLVEYFSKTNSRKIESEIISPKRSVNRNWCCKILEYLLLTEDEFLRHEVYLHWLAK